MHHKHRDSGFSLLESIFALAIVSASLGLMMQGLSANTQSTKRVEDKYFATILAQSNIQRVGYDIPLEPSLLNDSKSGYEWEVEIAFLDLPQLHDSPLETYEIRSRVFWGAPGAQRSVELVTARSRGVR